MKLIYTLTVLVTEYENRSFGLIFVSIGESHEI